MKRSSKQPNRYALIIEHIFFDHYQDGTTAFEFERSEIEQVAAREGIALPKNLGDLVYTFRYRGRLPASIQNVTPAGKEWTIRPAGRGRYRMELAEPYSIIPSRMLVEIKIPDATPGIITLYSLTDEQALLAVLSYNRLIDVFTSLTCYSLQSHLRTSVVDMGQVETDEVYVGLDKRGAHYVLPVQAKGRSDSIGVVQIEQDLGMCKAKWPDLICRPIAAQFVANGLIAMFEFADTPNGVAIASERHYRLVLPDEISPSELADYGSR